MRSVFLWPADSRPPTYEFPIALGEVAGIDVVVPPPHIFRVDILPSVRLKAIRSRLFDQSKGADGLILDLDAIPYGNLFASRRYNLGAEKAEEFLRIISELKQSFPEKLIFAFHHLPRLNPVEALPGTSAEELLAGELIAEWAKAKGKAEFFRDPWSNERVRKLEEKIPSWMLYFYQLMRERNLAVIRSSLKLVASGVIDFLAIVLDDTALFGVHRGELETIGGDIKQLGIEDRTYITPGTDETALVLLSRMALRFAELKPKICPIYSSGLGANSIGRYEDRPFGELVRDHVALAGGEISRDPDSADVLLFVHTPQKEQQEHVPGCEKTDLSLIAPFLENLAGSLDAGRNVALADVAYANGADLEFLSHVIRKVSVSRLASFAAWNTAGNTIGSAVSQALLRFLFLQRCPDFSSEHRRSADLRHYEFLLERFLDDGYYQGEVRQYYRSDSRQTGIARVSVDHEMWIRAFISWHAERIFPKHFRSVELIIGGKLEGYRIEKLSFPLNRYFEVSLRIKLYPEELRVVNIPSPRIVK